MPASITNGIFWYRDEATYLRFREIIEDKEQLAMTYAEWLTKAEKFLEEKRSERVFMVKVQANPDEFLAFCKLYACAPNSRARIAFASIKAREILGLG
jgi:hypothetical protein